jgi:hypothetical protein
VLNEERVGIVQLVQSDVDLQILLRQRHVLIKLSISHKSDGNQDKYEQNRPRAIRKSRQLHTTHRGTSASSTCCSRQTDSGTSCIALWRNSACWPSFATSWRSAGQPTTRRHTHALGRTGAES